MAPTVGRRRILGLATAAGVGTLLSSGPARAATRGPRPAAPVTVVNGTQFTTTDGDIVHAHGGGVLQEGEYYYWFGENRNDDGTFRYVSAYRSTDLATWEFRNHILTQQSDPELELANIERPKVIHNAATGQYVMWAHKENGVDYSEARACVAVADSIDGDYTWRGSFRPFDEYMSRDITAFVDHDGTGYMISAANENYDLNIYRLNDDYTDVAELVDVPWPGGHREAPAMFERDGSYVLVTSGASGWDPNQQQYATAPSPAGPWSDLHDLGDPTGFDSQTAFVVQIDGSETTSYVYMGDRWAGASGGPVNDSEYVWLPLEFTDDGIAMSWHEEIRIDTATGEVSGG